MYIYNRTTNISEEAHDNVIAKIGIEKDLTKALITLFTYDNTAKGIRLSLNNLTSEILVKVFSDSK